MISYFFRPFLTFNLILIFSFSVSVNSFIEVQTINYIFYILFHLTFIYFLFYHFHYSMYVIAFLYGILFDIILINHILCHLFSFIFLISFFLFFKKYLFLLSANQISITIFLTLITTLLLEMTLAYFFNSITFSNNQILMYFIISVIIFIPSIFIFNKLNK